MKSLLILIVLLLHAGMSWQARGAETKHYLFLGHPREDEPGEQVQREVERIDFSAFDLLLLGGDYTWHGTGTRATVSYLDAVFDLGAPSTLAALGNHDTAHKDYFTDATGRPRYFTFETNDVTFVVLDTTDDGQKILGGELQMLTDAINALPDNGRLVIVHHHLVWLADYPPLAHLLGDPGIGASSASLSGLNFYDDVYPLLAAARSRGVEVICLAGDRTGTPAAEFYIDHTTADGVRFIAAGLMEESPADLRTVVVLEHEMGTGTLTVRFRHLSDLPRIPDEPLIINELHYDPAPEQGNDWSFVELFNRGDQPYDLSGATFSSGVGFVFPENTRVAPGEYILVAADPGRYVGLGVQVFDYAGNEKPNSDDPMWLRDRRGLEIDFVAYGVADPWPSPPDDQGPSLMLIDPGLDNTIAKNWAASDQYGGTPGRANIVPPEAESFTLQNGIASVQWNGVVSNAWYRLDYAPSLEPAAWRPAGPLTRATANWIQLDDSEIGGADQRYFRLSREFP